VSWKGIDDTTWEVKLRKGVKFHDGTPFGAKDVKATFDRVLNPENKLTARGNHAKIKSVEVVDAETVRFKTDGPYPVFVERLTAQVMQSEKAIKEKGHEWMQDNPIGTGPYKLQKWSKKQEHLLVRNDDYWGPEARLQVRPGPDHPGAGHPDRRADVGRRRHHQGVPPDQMDVINKSGQGPTPRRRRSCARACSSSTRRAARVRTPSRTSACARPRTWPSTSTRSSST
jgi:peptide/nickel transport system substrate-binding protein